MRKFLLEQKITGLSKDKLGLLHDRRSLRKHIQQMKRFVASYPESCGLSLTDVVSENVAKDIETFAHEGQKLSAVKTLVDHTGRSLAWCKGFFEWTFASVLTSRYGYKGGLIPLFF